MQYAAGTAFLHLRYATWNLSSMLQALQFWTSLPAFLKCNGPATAIRYLISGHRHPMKFLCIACCICTRLQCMLGRIVVLQGPPPWTATDQMQQQLSALRQTLNSATEADKSSYMLLRIS